MKNTYIIIGVILAIAVIAFALSSRKAEPLTPANQDLSSSTAVEDGRYVANVEGSSIKWTAEYSSGASEEGVVSLKSGFMVVASGEPLSGSFEIDMATLRPESNIVLENLLKAPNILDVEAYPITLFVISKVLPNPVSGTTTGKYIIEGKLTVKSRTNLVSFPVIFSKEAGKLVAVSSFALNKSEWGIENKEIKNEVLIYLRIEFSKE